MLVLCAEILEAIKSAMESDLKAAIANEFAQQIEDIRHLAEQECGHFVLCYMDEWVLTAVLSHLESVVEKQFIEIKDCRAAASAPCTNAVFVVRIDQLRGPAQQSTIYALLESSRKDINLVLLTHSCMSLDRLERRIRSRLNHRIVFLPYLSPDTASTLLGGSETPPVPSCNAILREHLTRKHCIGKYELADFYRIFSPLHLSIMILCANKRVKHTNVVEEFKKLTIRCRELKNTPSMDILCSYFDILDSGAMDKHSRFLLDLDELKNFICREAPFYVRSLLK